MQSRFVLFSVAPAMLFAVVSAIQAQTFQSIPALAFDNSGPVLRAHAEAEKPFTVAGEHGVLVGQQNGTFESWVLPVKLLSHLTIEAQIDGYTVPIDVNRQVAQVEVRPDRTILTYAHIGFTVRQIMFSADQAGAGTGPVVLFEFDCLHPTDFIFRFTPELRWMWPARNEGTPSAEWVVNPGGGYYVLHSDYPDLAGAVTIPGAQPGILAPYQERPQVYPVELKLHIDPARDRGRLFPLLMAVGTDPAAASNQALGASLTALNAGLAGAYQAHVAEYAKLLAHSTLIETPDKALNEAFEWGVISIEQLRARAVPSGERALVAGYYASGDSARPGFGWFFGRDALYTLFAVNGYGDFALSKAELEFLINRQRADGKIMHEYSQTAELLDWKSFPYMYAAADATPLFLLAVADYVHTSGDVAFLKEHRAAVEKAWEFETSHDADGDGIYDNSQGTGWVESWPGGMPRQEIYMALLDQQASGAYAELEHALGSEAESAAGRARAGKIATTVEKEYYDAQKGCYAFATNPAGTANSPVDRTVTVYPSIAWWSGKATLAHGDECLRELALHTLQTDWGLRDVASDEKVYDGMSYHQGSVWPLFTGWTALAEYRGNQPLAGYSMLRENANLTWAQDLGADTELLSGDYFVPFGRSTSHQLWSSAMVITPTLKGLFGLAVDAEKKTITVNPQLPASWDHAEILNLQLPGGTASLYFTRKGDVLEVSSRTLPDGWKLFSEVQGAKGGKVGEVKSHEKTIIPGADGLLIPLPEYELDLGMTKLGPNVREDALASGTMPQPGARTEKFRVLSTHSEARKLVVEVEGRAGSDGALGLIHNSHENPKRAVDPVAKVDAAGGTAEIESRDDTGMNPQMPRGLFLHFPAGEGWKTMKVTLSW
jgi:glycogen debranching enzyme